MRYNTPTPTPPRGWLGRDPQPEKSKSNDLLRLSHKFNNQKNLIAMADFDFSVAHTISEFFKSRNLKKKSERKWTVSDCHSESGDTFPALKLVNGDTLDNGRSAVNCFALSRTLQEQGVVLTKEWVSDNKDSIMLIDAEDVNTSDGHDAKFGIIYLDTGGVDEWDEWE